MAFDVVVCSNEYYNTLMLLQQIGWYVLGYYYDFTDAKIRNYQCYCFDTDLRYEDPNLSSKELLDAIREKGIDLFAYSKSFPMRTKYKLSTLGKKKTKGKDVDIFSSELAIRWYTALAIYNLSMHYRFSKAKVLDYMQYVFETAVTFSDYKLTLKDMEKYFNEATTIRLRKDGIA